MRIPSRCEASLAPRAPAVSLKLISRSPKLAPRWTLSAAVSGTPTIDAGIGEADDPRQNELHFHLRRNTPTYLPFAAGILCVVARTNRKYLVDYPSRENIFMQLLRSLRELYYLVVERERAVRTLDAARNFAAVHA